MDNYIFLPSMSSSRSSSSLVRNSYGLNNNLPAKTSSDFGVRCKCDLPAPCQETWKEGTLDPVRRFFGCSQYKDPRKKCNFFLWADPPYSERAKDVIKEMKVKLMKKDDELHNIGIDMNFLERKMLVLDEEVRALRKENEDGRGSVHKMEKEVFKFRRMLVVGVVIIMIMWGAMN